MSFRHIKHIILSLLLCCIAVSTQATHLVGGSMSYEYVGRLGNGNFQYRVTLKVYRDCAASQVEFDDIISLGAYNATNNRNLARVFDFSKLSEIPVDPPRGANCPSQPPVCIREATYSRLIDLPASNFGYHLVWKRCCRNTQRNIIDDIGQTYYAFIPPTNIRNSSPFFTGVPAPYICQNDTTIYFNGASDPDGDSLSYRLVHPWGGLSDNSPVFTPPSNINIPFDNVTYRSGAGFNSANPFGPNGLASINPYNGLTTMLSPQQGRFALAIEVTEWRNGIALSTIRLDVQMIVIPCSPNDKPDIAPTTGGFNRTIQAGNTLCFDITSSDNDLNDINGQFVAQNITISGKGDIFGATGWTGPVATFATKTSPANVTSQFCWTPSCDQARTAPYNFVIDAIDDGCPPKSRSVTFTITVEPFIGQQNITGPINVCEGANSTYSIPFTAGHKYKWTVIGGTIVGGDDQSSVTISWTTVGTGRVRVIETSIGGCVGTPAERMINIAPKPPIRNITGQDTVCEFTNNYTYQVPAVAGNTFQWFVNGGTITAQPQPNQVTVNWGAIGNAEIYMLETNAAGCVGDTNRFPVVITKPLLDTLFGSPSVCPNISGVRYYVLPAQGATYQWFVEGGVIASGAGTPEITVNWGEEGIGFVKVVETLKWGCVGDTIRYRVEKGYNLKGIVPIGSNPVCEFTANERYEVINTNGSQYFWTLNGGTKAKDDSSYFVLVNWGSTGNGYVEVIERSYDSVNNRECISNPVRLSVLINPIPTADEIVGTFVLCQSTGTYNYTLNGFQASSYIWRIDGDSSNITGQGTNTVTIDWTLDGQFTLSVLEITKDSCTNLVVDSLVTVNKKPTTTPIVGDSVVCFPFYTNRNYTTTGFPTSTFNWTINSGTINSGNGSPLINVDWSGQQDNTIEVIEVSDKGCPGDTIRYDVFADDPRLKMRFVSVGFPDDRMETRWELTNAPKFNSVFTIQRSVAGSGNWIDAGTVPQSDFTFTDKNINTDVTPFDYRIKSQNLCKRDIYSDVHRSILLTGNKFNDDLYSVLINWTRYLGWDNGVRTYEVHRSNDFNPAYFFSKDVGSDTTDNYSDGFNNFSQRYRIKAYENGGNGDTSWSNEIFFNFDPVIWVPNAFTPNDDGLNSKFKIVYGSIKTFKLVIYDRWGEEMFSTTDIDNNWDGTFKGRPCPDGVYIYTLRYSGADNIIKNMAGNITLLR